MDHSREFVVRICLASVKWREMSVRFSANKKILKQLYLESNVKTWILGSAYKTCAICLAIGLVALLPESTEAQTDNAPAVVMTIASVNEQLDDIDYLANAASEEMGQMSGIVRMQANGFLRGIDMDRPSGVMMYFEEDEQEPEWVAFVPLKNMEDLLDNLSNFADVEEDGDLVTVVPDAGDEVILRKFGKHVFVSQNADRLKDLPKNPEELLEKKGDYNVAMRLFAQRVPKSLRDMVIDTIEESALAGLDDIEDDLQAEFQRASVELQMKQMKELIHETDEMMFGFAADKKGKRLTMDLMMKGIDGSQFEKRVAAAKSAGVSNFAGFLMPKAAVNGNMCFGLTEDDAKVYVDMVKDGRESAIEKIEDEELEEKKAEIAKKLANTIFDAMEETFKEGKLDAGAVVFVDDAINGAIGMRIADPKKVESAVKEIVASAEGDLKNDDIQFNLNSGSHRGVNMHEITMAVDADEDIYEYVGSQIKVILGVGEKDIYLAFGKEPVSLLKKAMDASSGNSTSNKMAIEYNMFFAPILRFAAEAAEEEMVEKMSEMLSSKGNDRIRASVEYGAKDVSMSLEIQDGLLSLLGVAAQNMGGMMGGGGGGGADF